MLRGSYADNADHAHVARLSLSEGSAPDHVEIGDMQFLFTAHFKKSGADLILTGDDGHRLVLVDYFNLAKRPDLTSHGATLSADLVTWLAGPDAPGQYAQAGAPAGAVVIGRVEIVSVNATVQHANGVVDNLKNGDSLLKGDVVMTGDGEGCTLSLIDGTALNMGSNGRMVLAELSYESNSTSNSALINLVKGSFVFVAGQVAHTGDMRVTTPVATMGIRGTTVGTYLDADVNGNVYQLTATLLSDPGGSSGAYDLTDPVTGAVLQRVRSTATQVTLSHGANNQLSVQEETKSPAIVQHELAVAQILFPIFLANPNNAQLNQTTPQAPNNSLTPPQLLPQPPQETDPNSAVHFNLLLIGGDAPVTQGATATNSLVITTTTETNVLQSVINATLTFADANIGRTNAAAVLFTVGGLNNAGNGTITFSDGNHANDVVVQIVNGLPASSTVNLSGMADGPITATLLVTDPSGSTFHATATAQLDQDLEEHPTVAFALANIGKANAGTVQFTVNGLEHDDSGTITFSDGNHAHDVVVNIVNGVPVSNSVNLSGLSDGPITATLSTSDPAGNTFNATATARLDQDLEEHPTVAFALANIGKANAGTVQFTVNGLEHDDSGTITFSDGNHAHDIVVNIVNGVPVSNSVNLSGLSDGPITATLSTSDPAGNTFNATATARLDQDLDEHPTVAFALANIGKANAGTVQFTVNGLEPDDNGAITFSDGNHAHDIVVNIVNGVPVSNSVNLSGLSDGPITATLSTSDPAGNTFNATATARLDQDLDEHPTVAFALANIGKANAETVQFTVNGLEPDDNGAITFSDGNHAHDIVVNIVNGVPVSNSVNLSGLSDGPITATLSTSDPAGNTFNATATARLDQDLDEHPTVAFALANIGKANAETVQFTVNGLEPDDNGAITFSDGNHAHDIVVNIVNGVPVSNSVNLSGLSDGPITATLSTSDPAGNTFNATATARLDQDLDEHPTVAFALANIGKANAETVQFTVNGLEPDDNGAITFSDGNHAHDIVVNIVNGVPVSNSVNLSGLSDGTVTATLSASDPAGNTFNAAASARLDQDLNEQVTISLSGLVGGNALEDQKITARVTDTDNDIPSSGVSYTWMVSHNGGNTWSTVGTNANTYTPSEADEGGLLKVLVSFTDAADNAESGSAIVGVLPLLTIADNSLSVSPNGTLPLGISLTQEPVPDDTISVTISFQSSGSHSPTISAGDHATGHPSTSGGITTYAFSMTDVDSGLTFTNHGDQSDVLTVKEVLNGNTVGTTQTITIIDPPDSGAVAGGVSSTIDSHTTLELAGASAAAITFANDQGNSGTLVLDSSASFTGQISGFAGNGTIVNSDSIDLKDVNFTTAKEAYAGGTLNVTDGVHSANLHFDGSYELSNFVLSSDGHGGTLVVDPPVSSALDFTGHFQFGDANTGSNSSDWQARASPEDLPTTTANPSPAVADTMFDQFHFGNPNVAALNVMSSNLVAGVSDVPGDHFQFAAMNMDRLEPHQGPVVDLLELSSHQTAVQAIIDAAAPVDHVLTPATNEIFLGAGVPMAELVHAVIHSHAV